MPQNASMEELGFIKAEQSGGKEKDLWWHPTDPFFTCERCKTLNDGTEGRCLWQRLYLMMGESELYRKKKCWGCVKAGVPCSCAVSTIDFNLVLRPGKPASLMGWDGKQVSQEQVVAAYHERLGSRGNEEGGESPGETDERWAAGPSGSGEAHNQSFFSQARPPRPPDPTMAPRPPLAYPVSPIAYNRQTLRPFPPSTHPGPLPPVAPPRPLILPIGRRPPLSPLSTLSSSQHPPPSVPSPVYPPNADPSGSSRPVPAAVHTAPICASQRTSSVETASHGQGIAPDGGAERTPRSHEPDWWYHRASFIREAQRVGGVPLINTFLTATGRGSEVVAGSISIHLNNIKGLLSQTGAELDLVIDQLRDVHRPPHSELDLKRATQLREAVRRMEWDILGARTAPDESASVDDPTSPPNNTPEHDDGDTRQEAPRGSSMEEAVWRQELEGAIEALREEVRVLHARNSGNGIPPEEGCPQDEQDLAAYQKDQYAEQRDARLQDDVFRAMGPMLRSLSQREERIDAGRAHT